LRGTPITYRDYSGGRNTQNAPYLLSEEECRDDLNVHTSLSGDIEKRTGFVTLSGSTLTGAPINGKSVHSLFAANAAAAKTLVGVSSTSTTDTIFKMTTAGVASALKTGMTANTRWYWAQAEVNAGEGPIFGMNGVDTPQRWNGSAASTSEWKATTGTVPAKGKYLFYFNERLWCAEGSRLWYSGLTGSSPDPMSWDANNYVDLDPNDGQEITGINAVGSYLIVTKSRKTYRIYDLITGANQAISSEIGCVSHRSMVSTPAGLLFLSEDQGVCQTDGSSVKPFSDQIQPDLREVLKSPTTMVQAAGTLLGRRYFLSVSLEGTRNDHTLEYDLIKQSWWLHSCAANQFALADPAGTPVLYSADATTSARVSKAFVEGIFEDNGASYKAFWTSPWYAWGVGGGGLDPHINKRINEIRTDGVGTWEAYIASDFEESFEAMQGETWSAANATTGTFEEARSGAFEEARSGTFESAVGSTVSIHYLTPALGRAHSVKYENTDSNDFRIYSTTFALTPRSN
jgi:hypothetical protein